MKKQLQILSLLISISFFSCNSADKTIPISDLNTDFTNIEKLEFKPFNKYDILQECSFMIDGSVLWYFSEDKDYMGYCYDLNTGEKLSAIISKGRAANELGDFTGLKMTSDSILFYANQRVIKTFSKKEIAENVPMGERSFSTVTMPDSILVSQMMKLPNGSVVASMNTTIVGNPIHRKHGINDKSVTIWNGNEAKSYETIDYNSFDIVNGTNPEETDAKELIKSAYSAGNIEIKGNDMAVFSVYKQFILYTLDLKSGKVVDEKRYTKMQREGSPTSLTTMNDLGLEIIYMKSNDKYIFCTVNGYFTKEDKEAKLRRNAIFVFDWDLNPIKRFDLPKGIIYKFIISNECDAVYFGDSTDEGLIMQKADLNI